MEKPKGPSKSRIERALTKPGTKADPLAEQGWTGRKEKDVEKPGFKPGIGAFPKTEQRAGFGKRKSDKK